METSHRKLATGRLSGAHDRTRAGISRERLGYFVVGLGAGGLADGFVLHQLLQWHHLWSSRTTDETLAGLEDNTLADGIFHAASLVVLLVGLALLVGTRLRARPLAALALMGWGAFNVVDQLVFHLVLGAHHIREGVDDYLLYDWGFFALGLALFACGLATLRAAGHSPHGGRDGEVG